MSYQKTPKQKSSYPGLLANFEQRRKNDFIQGKMQIKVNQQFKTNFASFNRKSPK